MPKRREGLAGAQPLLRAKKIAMLVYGDPGIGKTKLIGTAKGRTLIIRPPTDHTDSITSPAGEIEERIVHDWSEMDDVLLGLRSLDPGVYDWVWLDSISLFQDTGLDDIWTEVIAEKPHRARYDLDKSEYGINMSRLSRWTRHAVACAKDHGLFNFGITAHTRELRMAEAEDADEARMPWIQGKNMAPKICGYMNIVAYFEMKKIGGKKDTRVLRFNKTEDYYAKDQFDAFENGRLVNPSIPKIEKAIAEARPTTTTRRRRRR